MTLFQFQEKVNDSLIRQEQVAGSESLAMIKYFTLGFKKTSSHLFLFSLSSTLQVGIHITQDVKRD